MPKPGDVFGQWTLGERIDEGGQGLVFEASKGEAGSKVAFKVIKANRVKKRDRFMQEIKVHAELTKSNTANIVPLIDHNLDELVNGGVSGYLVMPLAWGSLHDAMSVIEGRFELALETLQGIVRGIQGAHDAGIIHRDIKPGNILFIDETHRNPLVTDFGICLLKETPRSERITDEGETVGAKFFMAPEQARGGVADVTEAADIYALGKLCHYMLTGRYLFREELDRAFAPDELETEPRLARVLDELLLVTIQERPEDRLQSAAELAQIVADILARQRGQVSGGGSVNVALSVDDGTGIVALGSDEGLERLPDLYQAYLDLATRSETLKYRLSFDGAFRSFDESWKTIFAAYEQRPKQTPTAVRQLIESQPEAIALTLCMARCDLHEVYTDWKGFVERVTRASEGRGGYGAVFSIPHPFAGFLYMLASVVALGSSAWAVLERLMTRKFEWYYQSGRPLYSHGFGHSYFFHAEALGREAPKIHDLYREMMEQDAISSLINLSGGDLLSCYAQTQMLMCLRAVQEVERGVGKTMWPDYGRFHAERVVPILDRIYSDVDFGTGLLAGFEESREVFFSKLNERLKYIPANWWSGSGYFWDSLDSWDPRH